jgi:hypothetical protein
VAVCGARMVLSGGGTGVGMEEDAGRGLQPHSFVGECYGEAGRSVEKAYAMQR